MERFTRPTEPNKPTSDFEKRLFAEGVTSLTPGTDLDRMVDDFLHIPPEISINEPSEGSVDSLIRMQTELLPWLYRFRGRIPKRWVHWYDVMSDFGEASSQKVQLSEVLVDAGISHPDGRIVLIAGTTQYLTKTMLRRVANNLDLPEYIRSEVEMVQIKGSVIKGNI